MGQPTHAVNDLAPFVHVANVERSAEFYKELGFAIEHSLKDQEGKLCWCFMKAGNAKIMFSRARGEIAAEAQAVILYMYCDDAEALRRELIRAGVVDRGVYRGGPLTHEGRGEVFAISYPAHMPAGELRVHDPDGYCILVGQLR